jgi:SAM-dependent methyltransferase
MSDSVESFAVEVDPFYADDLQQMARAENYRRWQFDIVAPFVTGTVLEVGGGIGNFTPELAEIATSVISIEPNEYCFRQLVARTKGLANVTAYRATVESLDEVVPSIGKRVDTIILMNVLEHIQDDKAVLGTLKSRLTPNGRLVVLVPAGEWAFGSIDRRLGHYRRYSKDYSRALVVSLGLEIEKMRYYNFIGVFAWWWNAKISKRQSQNDGQIKLFDKLFVPVISRVEKIFSPPVGQSLLIVARHHSLSSY